MNYKETTEMVYLDYINNFLTVAKFAEHYGISEIFADQVITEGRRINKEWAEMQQITKEQLPVDPATVNMCESCQ